MDQVLIVGMSGLVGSHIAKSLTDDPSIKLSGLARSDNNINKTLSSQVQMHIGDLENKQDMEKALDGITQLIIAVSGKPGQCDRIEHKAVVQAATIAATKGVKRIIYISGASTPYAPNWFEAGSAKKKAEAELQQLPIEVVILRPSWLMESLPRFERNGGVSVIGAGEGKAHWVSAADLGQLVKQIIKSENNLSGAYTILGPEAITISDAAEAYAKANNLNEKVQKMPLWIGRTLSMMVADLKPVVELARVYSNFDESNLSNKTLPFPKPATTLNQWLNA